MRAPLRSLTTVRPPRTPCSMCMPPRLMERIDPLGRMLADPPPLRETFLPGGVRLPTLLRLAVAGRPPAAPGRPPVAGRPAAVPGRPPVVVWPAVVPGRLPVVVWPAVVPGRLPVVVWPAVVPARLPVVVWPAVEPAWLVVVPREGVELCDCVVPREGVEVCDCVAPCDAVDGWEGALALGAALGALPPPLGLCWPHAHAGTIRHNENTSHLCTIFSLLEVRFIPAS
jgi:hypothetical protein